MQHRFWVTLATATTLSQALGVFGVKSGHWCLILKHLFFIRAHNWDSKNQEDEVGGSKMRSAHENFDIFINMGNSSFINMGNSRLLERSLHFFKQAPHLIGLACLQINDNFRQKIHCVSLKRTRSHCIQINQPALYKQPIKIDT